MGRFFNPWIDEFFRRRKEKRQSDSNAKYYEVDDSAGFDMDGLFDRLNTIDSADPYALWGIIPTTPSLSPASQMRELTLSPQVRKIPPSTTLYIPFFIVPRNTRFQLTGFSWLAETGQGDQDLIVRLFFGSDKISQSGKVSSISTSPPFADLQTASESRQLATIGVPSNSISSTSGSGLPDNYSLPIHGTHAVAQAGETVYAVVQNQSSVFNHGIELFLRGYSSPLPEET